MFSLYSKSQKTGVSFDSESEASKGIGGNQSEAAKVDADGMTTTTAAAMRNPVLLEMQEFFEQMEHGVTIEAEKRLAVLD